jgi:serine/threonine protein kinase
MVFKKPLFSDFGNLTKDDYLNIKIPKKDHKNRDINKNLYNLLESLLKFNPEERPTISKLKKDPWLTDNMTNPLPDVIKEALFYSLELTKRQIKEVSENDEKKNESSNNDDEEMKDNKENEEEEESSDDSESSNES